MIGDLCSCPEGAILKLDVPASANTIKKAALRGRGHFTHRANDGFALPVHVEFPNGGDIKSYKGRQIVGYASREQVQGHSQLKGVLVLVPVSYGEVHNAVLRHFGAGEFSVSFK